MIDSIDLDVQRSAYHPSQKFHNEQLESHLWLAKRIALALEKQRQISLLSLGIGHKVVAARLIDDLSDRISKYVILEGSEDSISDFRSSVKLSPKVEIVNSLFEEYTSPDKFDVIEMGFVLEHVDDPQLILGRYREMLKPSGVIFATVPNAASLHRRIGSAAGLLDDIYQLSSEDLELGHQRYFDCETFTRLFIAAGLKIVRTEGIFLKPVTTSQFESLNLSDELVTAFFQVGTDYPELCNSILIEAAR